MLQAHAAGSRGHLIFLGFTPHDLAHLTSNKPLNPDAKSIGIESKPVVILFETDPMVEFYAAQPWAITILFRQSTIDAMKGAGTGFVELPMKIPGVPANTTALLFFAPDDKALVERLDRAKMTTPQTKVVEEGVAEPVAKPRGPSPAASPKPGPTPTAQAGPPRAKTWVIAIICTLIALFLAFAPFFMHVKSVAGVLGGAALFGASGALMFWILWKTRKTTGD